MEWTGLFRIPESPVLIESKANEEGMDIKAAQQDVRTTFMHGSVGQTISGVIWLVSAVLGTWVSERYAILLLVMGGAFIFPLTQLTLRLLGRSSALPKGHPMNQLATQVAFIVPFSLPLIGAASLYNLNWFYPAFMLVVGTHYLPFMFLYGMWEFAALAGILIFGSVGIGMWLTDSFTFGGWFTAVVLLAFALWVRRSSDSSRR
jgi:hypothetical protein